MINEILIENYFSNRLDRNSLQEFEVLYQSNIEFKNEVDFLKNIKVVAQNEDRIQFKAKLTSFEKTQSITNKNRIA